jgi:hypothetical protein
MGDSAQAKVLGAPSLPLFARNLLKDVGLQDESG